MRYPILTIKVNLNGLPASDLLNQSSLDAVVRTLIEQALHDIRTSDKYTGGIKGKDQTHLVWELSHGPALVAPDFYEQYRINHET